MSIISHLHQLFNEEMCQAYLHKLRWKDRPLACPHCESEDIGPWGVYHRRPGFFATAARTVDGPSTI